MEQQKTMDEQKNVLNRDILVQAARAREELDKLISLLLKDETWRAELRYNPAGELLASQENFETILRHDEQLASIRYNSLTECLDVFGSLPWQRLKSGWADADLAALASYISTEYEGVYSVEKLRRALHTVALERAFNPAADYLNRLLEWDGVPRLDLLLVDTLGAEDTPYTRAVTRKTFTAAVARCLEPGVKFDSVLVLNGPQGIGKSTLFRMMGKEWYSESLAISDMNNKTAAEKMRGFWILELSELAGLRETQVETVRNFISRTSDDYRVPYAVYVESHPRKSILVGTTNSSDGFLRDTEGNRRFWPVVCSGDTPEETKPWNLTDEEIDLLWAEAVHYYRAKEPLHLDGEMAAAAKQMQQTAMEQDPRLGQTEEFLAIRLPRDFSSLSGPHRLRHNADYMKFLHQLKNREEVDRWQLAKYDFCIPRESVSRVEIWVECYGRKQELFNQKESTRITALLKSLGWQQAAYATSEAYGRQRVFTPPEGWAEKVSTEYDYLRACYDSRADIGEG